jgi:asparagine synthase (glutamine-hydrolysing)
VDALEGRNPSLVQGAANRPVRPECLRPEFAELAGEWSAPRPFPDALRNTQYRDARFTKIPRALRFNDRVSMRVSTELREPFLDHRLFELALRQPADRKISGGVRKRLLRRIASRLLPVGVVEAPKRPLQTPQREWLRGPLRAWAGGQIDSALESFGDWLDEGRVRKAWNEYQAGAGENSFHVWQWISLGQLAATHAPAPAR